MIFGLVFLFGIVFGLILVAYDDGLPLGLYRRIQCKLGNCRYYIKVGKTKINKYYCIICRKPRSFPVLKVVDDDKMGDNKFRR